MQPSNWYKYQSNLPTSLRKAFSVARSLPRQDVGIYCQDKSSRICFASLSKTNQKVEQVLADSSKYRKLRSDQAMMYQPKIKSWYRRYKQVLHSIPEDISEFLVPEKVATPHLKVLIKTHKPNCPVRLTFSSIGSTTSNLSTTLDHTYLKPTVTSGLCKRRLGDTRDALLFLEQINSYLWENNIQSKPTIFSMDVVNFFPSVPQSLALPAISRFLSLRGLPQQEIAAVISGLKLVRNGNFFRWKDVYYNQISGCALGDPDSCSYSDLSMADLLDRMIPACEQTLNVPLDPHFKVYRDDGLGVVVGDDSLLIPQILDFFNSFNSQIQWTIPMCNICSSPEATCPHYKKLEFLDCCFTWKRVQKNNILIWQFEVQSFSKSTDCHAYLAPNSCSAPHLNSSGASVAKTVGTRLRTIHSNDARLLHDLNLYSGYLIARGYKEESIKFHLANMANRSRENLLEGSFSNSSKFVLPLVTTLHPSTTILSKLTKEAFLDASKKDPVVQFLFPQTSIIVSYKRLPNLQLLLCKNDQNALAVPQSPNQEVGYQRTNCRCQVCQISLFGKYIRPPSMPGFQVKMEGCTTCNSGPAVIYHIICTSNQPQCQLAHYVGSAYSSNPGRPPMKSRWANHKSHFKHQSGFCYLTDHLTKFHRGEDPQQFMTIQILQQLDTFEEIKNAEVYWTRKLFAYHPSGLNRREEATSNN